MLEKKQSIKAMIIPLILIVVMISGCASTNTSASSTAGTGTVTETSMTNTVETSGTVSAKQLATLTWGTSGNVLEVDSTTGQQVSSGDILMKLDPTTAPSDVIQAISTLVTAKQNLETAKQSNTALANAEVALTTAQDNYDKELGYSYTLNKPIGTADYNAILKANVLNDQAAVTKAQDYYNGFAETPDSDTRKAAALATLAQARITLKTDTAIYNYYISAPNSMDTASINANFNLAKAQLDDAQRAYDLLKNGNNTDAITSAQAAVDAAQATVNELNITAPFNGEVAVVYSQVGDVVSAGTQALTLVDRSQMYLDVLVDETSISQVKVGNSVDISFDSLGIKTTGKVTLINPIGVSSSGVVNYTVRVELDKTDPKILLGATATVVITTGAPQNVLFVPVSAVLSDSQGEYVMRVNSSGATERVTVVSGQIVDNTVIVVGDLKKGDEVQLFSSTSSSSTTSGSTTRTGGGGFPVGGPAN
jgi:RND family efflux transporter MFP subunit